MNEGSGPDIFVDTAEKREKARGTIEDLVSKLRPDADENEKEDFVREIMETLSLEDESESQDVEVPDREGFPGTKALEQFNQLEYEIRTLANKLLEPNLNPEDRQRLMSERANLISKIDALYASYPAYRDRVEREIADTQGDD